MVVSRMGAERHVRLFRNGRSQAVRIPKEFELPGEEAVMRKEDGKLILEPTRNKSTQALLDYLDALAPIDDKIGDIPDLPPEPFEP
jgi:antitoxin VapB